MMKTTIFTITLLLFTSLHVRAQDYVDIFKASANFTQMGNLENAARTNIFSQNVELYLPKRINEDLVLLAGFTFENTTLNLLNGVAKNENLMMLRLNLGVKHQHTEKWGGTYVVLPKIATNFKRVGLSDFQIGGLALIDYKISDYWKFKFGVYLSSENHGSTITPLLGLWHRSKNGKFYINATLPIKADINYNFVKGFSLGADLLTSVKAYNISQNTGEFYVQEEVIRAALYASYGFLDKALILRARAGLDFTDYSLFNMNDPLGAQLLLFPIAGKDRTRLNPEYKMAFYLGFDLIYRFDLTKEKK